MRGGRWLRGRIETYLAMWVPRLGLNTWQIVTRWRPDRAIPRGVKWKAFDALAVRWPQRMDANLYFNLPSIAKNTVNDRALEETVVHELVHVLADTNEEKTNALARALARALVRARRGE